MVPDSQTQDISPILHDHRATTRILMRNSGLETAGLPAVSNPSVVSARDHRTTLKTRQQLVKADFQYLLEFRLIVYDDVA
jgi:hypothetical protein